MSSRWRHGRLDPVVAGPRVETGVGVRLADRAFVEAGFEQEVEGVAHHTSRLHPQMIHHLTAVERRADGIELLLLAQLRDADLEVVHPPLERARPVLVAGSAVAA